MSIIDDTAEFYADTITITRQTFDAWGAPTPGASVTVSARISNKVNKVMGPNGEEVVSSLMATISSVPSIGGVQIKTDDEFTLPARFSPNKPRAKSIQVPTDENGPLFMRVYF